MYQVDIWTILMFAALGLGLLAQGSVKSAYAKYLKVPTSGGLSAAEVAADLLRKNGNEAVLVQPVSGTLSDHYDPRSDVLGLSEGVYHSSSVAALGIAAHEAGHAMQKREGYAPLALRGVMVPVVNIGSNLSFPIVIAGLALSVQPLIYAGIALFALAVAFSLITLPVEFNASRRGIRMLTQGGYITADEERGVRKVLSAAAMTYVASAIGAVVQLMRLLALSRASRRR
ncbi:MAG: zinc metallopeptidase [Christensenellales bacterium]